MIAASRPPKRASSLHVYATTTTAKRYKRNKVDVNAGAKGLLPTFFCSEHGNIQHFLPMLYHVEVLTVAKACRQSYRYFVLHPHVIVDQAITIDSFRTETSCVPRSRRPILTPSIVTIHKGHLADGCGTFSWLKTVTIGGSPMTTVETLNVLPPTVQTLKVYNLHIVDQMSPLFAPSLTSFYSSHFIAELDRDEEEAPVNDLLHPMYFSQLPKLTTLMLYMNTRIRLTPGSVPSSVTRLRITGIESETKLQDVLPAKLQSLYLGCNDVGPFDISGFSELRDIDFGNVCSSSFKLPSTITNVRLGVHQTSLQGNIIPSTVMKLDLGVQFRSNISDEVFCSWPNLRHLTTSYDFNHPLSSGGLSSLLNLRVLKFGALFNQRFIPGVLPETLEYLSFEMNFNQPLLPGVLPASLLVLELGWAFDQEISDGVLNHTRIRWLSFGECMTTKRISRTDYPPDLEFLFFSSKRKHVMYEPGMPTSLRYIGHIGCTPQSPSDLYNTGYFNLSASDRILVLPPYSSQPLTALPWHWEE